MVKGLTQDSREAPEHVDLQALRKRFCGPYIAANGFTPETSAAGLRLGQADLVSFGGPFLSNPDFVERIRHGGPFAEQAPKDT